jgi:hypothetical protein
MFTDLPISTVKFVDRLVELGFDQTRIYGLFVVIGMCAGAPNTKEKIDELFSNLQKILPIDRSKNIDEVVGHLYDGYDRQLNEFCFRSGTEFNFREIKVPKVEKSFYIVNLQNEGLLDQSITSVKKLSDSTKLFDSLLCALGKSSENRNATLIEAFCCGIFQMQLHAQSDVNGAMQIAELIKAMIPPFFSRCFIAVYSGQVDYFVGLVAGQISLLSLMQPMEHNYAKQMWGFQSSIFFKDSQSISGIDDLTNREWYELVIEKAIEFDKKYPTELLPLSSSNVELSNLPTWSNAIRSFEICDAYIEEVWGYSSDKPLSSFESLEYKALLLHLIYSTLTSTREILH